MTDITGQVYFDGLRKNDVQNLSGIPNVPIVLQSVDTPYQRLAVLTDPAGEYAIRNVPPGRYRIVEAYGEPAVPSPGNFDDAIPGPKPDAALPPISIIPSPPEGATHLDCVTPSTLLVTVGADLIGNRDFLNGPVRYIPIDTIMDNCAVVCPINLLGDADYGTMGIFSPGTEANTGEPTEPYPANVPDFAYVLPLSHPVQTPGYPEWFHAPEDGEYTVQNILNDDNSNRIGAWWRIADHTTGNETGRMMVINGYDPGSVFFTEEVTVTPNTFYLFSAWIIDLFKVNGWADPRLGVRILDENGHVIYSATLGVLIPVNTVVPEWRQIGTVISSYGNTKLTVMFLSEGSAAIGNDYAIDDISLNKITVPVFTPVKSISQTVAFVGETVTYQVILKNTCTFPLTDVTFTDKLPQGVAFVPGSVTVNGLDAPTADPEAGFALPDIAGGEEAIVRFRVSVESAEYSPALNTADMHYKYTPVEGGIPVDYDVKSNEVTLVIKKGDMNMNLYMSKIAIGAALVGGEFTFGIFEPDASTPRYTAKNDKKGLITFPAIHFTATGQFHYIVKEIDGPTDWEKDTAEWPIRIDVTNVQGDLVAAVTYPNGVPVFINKHHNAMCGAFRFPDLTFDKPGVYEYTLKELTPSGDGWTTDDRVIKVIVTVTDDGHGNLIATVEYPDGFPTFTNIYKTKPTHIIISGCKTAIGAPLPPGRFEFGLFDSEGNLIATTTNGEAAETKTKPKPETETETETETEIKTITVTQ
ncbi:MAG: hypothetical protein FWE90_04915 [Defluviitaleaceae bacterium]|nr:hypothetical protein [Defluviitaleaceae bacterium]